MFCYNKREYKADAFYCHSMRKNFKPFKKYIYRWNGLNICWSLRIRRLLKLLLSCHSVWVGHFCFAFFGCVGSTVVIYWLCLVLLCQGGNVQNGRCVLIVAGCQVEHVMVELKEEGYNLHVCPAVEVNRLFLPPICCSAGLYLLLSVCQLVTHEGQQFGERWPVAGIQSPTLAHHPVPGEQSYWERRWNSLQ